MELPEIDDLLIDTIPEIFHNSDGEKFTTCMRCNTDLINKETEYIIERAFRRYPETGVTDVIFEFAMCHECMQTYFNTYSESSRKNIDQFILENTDLVERRKELIKKEEILVDDWVGSCCFTGKKMEECEEYQIAGQFFNNFICYTYLPWMMSDDAVDQLVNLLSNETLGAIDDFYDEYIDLTSGLSGLLNRKRKPVPLI